MTRIKRIEPSKYQKVWLRRLDHYRKRYYFHSMVKNAPDARTRAKYLNAGNSMKAIAVRSTLQPLGHPEKATGSTSYYAVYTRAVGK